VHLLSTTATYRTKQGKVSSMQIGFSAEVIDIVNTLGPPSWDLIEEAIEKLLKENRL
jgi:hypothetical protein